MNDIVQSDIRRVIVALLKDDVALHPIAPELAGLRTADLKRRARARTGVMQWASISADRFRRALARLERDGVVERHPRYSADNCAMWRLRAEQPEQDVNGA